MAMNEQSGFLFQVVPQHLALEAMRDSGYRNTAYAVAELIDNSIEANASEVQLHVVQSERGGKKFIEEVAILDNGFGMDANILRGALQFGYGTRRERRGIGRFGMGLPNASISQCSKVELYSWQNGPTNALRTWLDAGQVTHDTQIPAPQHCELPSRYQDSASDMSPEAGTLVVWSQMDEKRVNWRRAKTLIEHVEQSVGRIYRRFINDDRVTIKFFEHTDGLPPTVRDARAIDPMFLMANTATPAPFDQKAMFEPFSSTITTNGKLLLPVNYAECKHEILLRFSVATPETVEEAKRNGVKDRGSTSYGKYALRHSGISVIRAGRELELDKSWCHDGFRDRWWGVEIDFPTSLDEVFGVTNNKQHVSKLFDNFGGDATTEKAEGESSTDFHRRLEEDGDLATFILFKVRDSIKEVVNQMRNHLRNQTKRSRPSDNPKSAAEQIATRKIEDRRNAGYVAEMDKKEPAEHTHEIEQDFQEDGATLEQAQEKTQDIVVRRLRAHWEMMNVDAPAFFQVKDVGGVLKIILNQGHPLHEHLFRILQPEMEPAEEEQEIGYEEARRRMNEAVEVIKILLFSWGRMELELPFNSSERENAKQWRHDWGTIARKFVGDE